MYHVFRWIEKWVVLRSSHSSEYKREEFMMHLYFLSINNDYRSHMFLNLTDKVWFKEKWVKTQVLIDNECESTDMIDMRYVWKQHLKTWKFKHNMILRDFNNKITLITYMITVKLWFSKHVKYVKLYVHDLKNKYDIILEFK